MKKNIFKAGIAFLLISSVLNISCSDDSSDDSVVLTKADFSAIQGTYDELFAVTSKPAHDAKWVCAVENEIGQVEGFDAYLSGVKYSCTGDIYGEEAVKKYANSQSMKFDCYFINGVRKVTFAGSKISAKDEKGNILFDHEYYEEGNLAFADMPMEGKLYSTKEADAGEFKYFLIMPDTPAETFHIEFRYGSNKEDLKKALSGPYAYWLAGGISEEADEQMITNVINLFCEESFEYTQGTGTDEDPYVINTASQLQKISHNLKASYKLGKDIDLKDFNIRAIGSFVPKGSEGEESETPDAEFAFTGKFDGDGKTISNLYIKERSGGLAGLFACVSNTSIKNLVLENVNVEGTIMTGSLVSYLYKSELSDITLKGNNTVKGNAGVILGQQMQCDMTGGIVGAAMDSKIKNCKADADIVVPDAASNAGIVGGGLEVTDLIACEASGTVTAGDNAFGLGGISGCAFGANEVTGCKAANVTIICGKNSRLIGGITGYAGGYEGMEGVNITAVTGCSTENAIIKAGENSTEVSGIIGGGFSVPAYGAPYDKPTNFTVSANNDNTEIEISGKK